MAPAEKKAMGVRIAEEWGTAFTKSIVEGDWTDFKNLFDDIVTVVLQNGEGAEAEFTLGEEGSEAETDLTWKDFYDLATADLKEQSYKKSEAICLGVLGDRVLMETGRFNNEGEVYSEAYTMVTINPETGKINVVESFTDPQSASLMSAVTGEV